MKIFVVLPYLTNIGGAGRYGWELSEFLAKHGDDVSVISLYTDKNLYKSENIHVIDLADKTNFTQSLKFWLSLPKISKQLALLVEKDKPDVVFFNHFPSTLWVRKYKNVPTLCYPQDVDLLFENTYTKNLSLFKQIIWKILRIFVRKYDKKKWKIFNQIICNSKFSASSISQKYNIEPIVIYPGTDTGFFTPSQKDLKEKLILLMADNRTRRADFFLKSLPILLKKRNDFKIWIVGNNGEYEAELREIVKKLDINHLTTFFGRVSDSKLRELYSSVTVFVHLQKKHPFGLIFIESMSCGTPVIACKPGATEEIIDDGNTGFLINENDGVMLMKCVEKFLDNPELSISMGIKGRDIVRKNFESLITI